MGNKTKIDWADATWNPVTGCLHDCEYCYARRIAERFGANQMPIFADYPVLHEPVRCTDTYAYMRDAGISTGKIQPYPFGFLPTFHRYKLDEPQHWKKPRTIFVCSMADLFGEWVPDEWIQEIFEACDKASQHRYMFLTKNPGRYMELPNLLPKHRRPPNVAEMWFGQSFTGVAHKYTPPLLPLWQNRFTSIEPLLRNLSRAEAMEIAATNEWVIVGAETGNRKGKVIPEKSWIDNIATACAELRKPIFMKESLRGLMGADFRQEFPWEAAE
nr:MAG TPA: Protein of unknown function (DUF5131) [Caudoviricetes sp.]